MLPRSMHKNMCKNSYQSFPCAWPNATNFSINMKPLHKHKHKSHTKNAQRGNKQSIKNTLFNFVLSHTKFTKEVLDSVLYKILDRQQSLQVYLHKRLVLRPFLLQDQYQ